MLTRRALLSRTAHAFAGAALASMMRWWPKQEEEPELEEDVTDIIYQITPEESPLMTIAFRYGDHVWVSRISDPR